MVTYTELYKIIISNNYNTLLDLVNKNEYIDFNIIISNISLIDKAIEVRARECFDILIEIPNLMILSNPKYNGYYTAIKYMLLSDNPTNEYYLMKLINKKLPFNDYILTECINIPNIFNIMFFEHNKTSTTFERLLEKAINKNNNNLVFMIYEHLENSDYSFYNNLTKTKFNKLILHFCINSSNIEIFELLINKNTEWKTIDNKLMDRIMNNRCNYTEILNNSTNSVPILYFIVKYDNNIIFKFIFNHYNNLSKEELNNILGIKILDYLLDIKTIDKLDNIIYYLPSILTLPIDFNDFNNIIIILFRNIYTSYYFNMSTYKSRISFFDQLYEIIYILYKNNKNISNPYNYLINESNKMNTAFDEIQTRFINNQNIFQCYKAQIRKLFYIYSYFGWEPPNNFSQYFKNNNDIDIETEKIEFINSLKNK